MAIGGRDGSAQAENCFGGPQAACHVPRETVSRAALVENCGTEDKWEPVGLKMVSDKVHPRRRTLGAPDNPAGGSLSLQNH